MLLFGVVTGWTVVTVAKTGLVTIPVVSAWVFHPAAPSRIVTVTADTSTDRFALTPGPDKTITVVITEQELTKLLRQSVGNRTTGSSWQVRGAQIAVRADAVELFVALAQPTTTIVLEAIPTVTAAGQLQLTAQSALLGSLALPAQLVSIALDRSFNQLLADQFATEPVVPLRATLTEGAIAITFQPKAAVPGRP